MREPILFLFTIGFNVLGQFLLKRGMSQVGVIRNDLSIIPETALKVITTPALIGGLVAYALSSIFWLVVLSRVDLSYAYPILSLGYVLVVLISWLLLGENVTWMRWAGVVVVCFGVWLVSRT
ncbi:MAG: SMR family transporter [Anaerolineae bacterium]